MSEIAWGPVIEVNGKRPEWLADETTVEWLSDGYATKTEGLLWSRKGGGARDVIAIRLPADHPHYATLSTPTAPNTPAGYSDEVVGRAMALARLMAGLQFPHGTSGQQAADEARAIVALIDTDADEQYARDLLREQGWQDEREIGSEAVVRMIAMARRQSPHCSKGE